MRGFVSRPDLVRRQPPGSARHDRQECHTSCNEREWIRLPTQLNVVAFSHIKYKACEYAPSLPLKRFLACPTESMCRDMQR